MEDTNLEEGEYELAECLLVIEDKYKTFLSKMNQFYKKFFFK